MGSEASSVQTASSPKGVAATFQPLFPISPTASLKPPPSQASTNRLTSPSVQQSNRNSPSRSGKKTIHEINQHVSNLHNYNQQKQQKLDQAREQAAIDKECTFKPKLNTVRSASPRSFRQFYQDQQRYQQEKERSLERQRKIRQKQKQNAENDQLEKNKKSTSREKTNKLVDRLYDTKKNSSISKASKEKSASNDSKKRYIPPHQIVVNSGGAKSRGEEMYDTFKKKMEEKTVLPSLPPKPANMAASHSEKSRCQRLIKDYQEAVAKIAEDAERLSYVEFGEMLKKVGFSIQSAQGNSGISPLLARQRTLVYEAWKHLVMQQTVHSQDLLSFIFAVMGSDLRQYLKYGSSPSSANDSFRSKQAVTKRFPKESKFSGVRQLPDEDELFVDDQLSKQSAPNRLSSTENGFGNGAYEQPSEQDYGNSAPSAWESNSNSKLSVGYLEEGRLFYSRSDIERLRRHFSDFSINRLHQSKEIQAKSIGTHELEDKIASKKSPPKGSSLERKKVADQQMFLTRKARILNEAVELGLIDNADNVSHIEYLALTKRIEDLKKSQQRDQLAKEELKHATFRPNINKVANDRYIRERIQYTSELKQSRKGSTMPNPEPSQDIENQQQNGRIINSRAKPSPPPSPAKIAEVNTVKSPPKKLPVRYNTKPPIKQQEYDLESKPTADELPILRTDRSEEEQYQNEIRLKQSQIPPAQPQADTILHVDIRVNSRQVERVSLRLTDDPSKVALAFVHKYQLDPNLAGKLKQVIQMNIDKVRQDTNR